MLSSGLASGVAVVAEPSRGKSSGAEAAAAAGAGKGGGVTASVARVGDATVVTVTAPGREVELRARPEFIGLAQAAEREGGALSAASGPESSVMLILELPGLQKATARL